MLRKLVVLAALAVFMAPTAAFAQFDEGDWELTLTGSGSSSDDFDSSGIGVGGSLGYFFTDAFEAGVRQNVAIADTEGGSTWNGSTSVFVDYHFDLDRWQPFVGAFLGFSYGDDVDDNAVAGPEGGVKYFVNSTTFIFATVQYQIALDDDDADDLFVYGLGIGVKW